MKHRAVAKVLIDSQGQLFVMPELEPGRTYEYIYREGNGLRWHKTLHALHAYEPKRWEHEELLRHIVATLRSACDEDLRLVESTAWEDVSPELQARLRASLT
jgi:hypothetical protein